jgi:hypothetical protein
LKPCWSVLDDCNEDWDGVGSWIPLTLRSSIVICESRSGLQNGGCSECSLYTQLNGSFKEYASHLLAGSRGVLFKYLLVLDL